MAAGRSIVINPPKMCQPMGAVLAYLGVRGVVPLVHGSQGCCTYPRYNIARHFKESAEIAVTSLSESAAVYGGARNLTEAIKNIRDRINPEGIGICTTCMSETIGDDVKAIAKKSAVPGEAMRIIPASTPSYVGTHLTGWDNTVRALVDAMAVKGERNGKLNVVTGLLNPGDIREIKSILKTMRIEPIFLVDISDNLDTPIYPSLEKPMMTRYGTTLAEIADTPNSLGTIAVCRSQASAAALLKNKFGVPAASGNAPIGVDNTDTFVKNAAKMAGRPVPEELVVQRGRLIDAMVDVHHYSYGKKVGIAGDPDLVSAMARFCAEAGMHPVVALTATKSRDFLPEIKAVNAEYDLNCMGIEGSDLYEFQEKLEETGCHLVLGNSKAKDVADDLKVPLVRFGFPVYDRVGTYRYPIVGYNGSIYLLDQMINAILGHDYDDNKLHQ
jgi:nitrogenase molybdenum-iron protein beta chain